jgi:hypothetical protein
VRIAGETGMADRGDLIGTVAGLPGHSLGTNLFEVRQIPMQAAGQSGW